MLRLERSRRELPGGAQVLAPPQDSHYDLVVQEPAELYDGDQLVVAFSNDIGPHDDLLRAVRTISYQTRHRTGGQGGGMLSTSRIFGFRSRITVRKDFCSVSSLARESPEQHAVLERWAGRAADFYRGADAARYERQASLVSSRVLPEWVIPGSLFTSGICNYNNPLRYHYDSGNFSGLWSVMAALTRDVQGGYLVIPEYGVAFSFQQPSLIAFDGQGLLHGVSPIHKQSPRGYRYSVVWYTLRQMCKCLTPEGELQRIREVKTQRELKRRGPGTPGEQD